MSFDFNEKGKQYKYTAGENDKTNYDVLGISASDFFHKLQKIVSITHQNGDAHQKILMIGAQGCLERLTGFLIQSQRLSKHNENIHNQTAPPPGAMTAFRNNEALFDFETLLFHARALIDRITFFIAKQIYNQACDKPNKLKNVLINFIGKDSRANAAINYLDETIPIFRGLIIDSDTDKSLRSHLIHKSTSGESMTCAFTIYTSQNKKVLRFDYEINTYPLIGSAWLLSNYVPYLSLNMLAVYLGYNSELKIDECIPMWENNLICFSKQIDQTGSGPLFSMIKINPSGFELISKNLKQSILSCENK